MLHHHSNMKSIFQINVYDILEKYSLSNFWLPQLRRCLAFSLKDIFSGRFCLVSSRHK